MPVAAVRGVGAGELATYCMRHDPGARHTETLTCVQGFSEPLN